MHPPSTCACAGVQVLSIDGAPTEGWDGDRAAKSLRGRSGSSVVVRFARRSSQVPGVAGRPEQPPRVEYTQARTPTASTSPFKPSGTGHACSNTPSCLIDFSTKEPCC